MLKELTNDLIKYNEAYRLGNPLISDKEYDELVEKLMELDPNNSFLTQVGYVSTDDSRKIKLPITMASMNKIKTIEEFNNWLRLKNIPQNTELIATPKFDGLSLCALESTKQAATRGDGKVGQKSDNHFQLINNKFGISYDEWVYGEVIMPKKTFIDKYSNDFANPRNLVAGLMNNKNATNPLQDCLFIRYGIDSKGKFSTKKQLLDFLNTYQSTPVNYDVIKASDITEDKLKDLFYKWSVNFEIDGIILEVNDLQLQEKLGRETSSGNPVWARAYKSPDFEQVAQTTITGISWNISKQGLLKPTIHVNPIKLDGVTVSNVTGNNARFVKDMGLGIGAVIKIKRSGMVIPLITEVIKSVDWVEPTIDGVELEWNDNGIELRTVEATDDQKLKQLISFFEILEVDNVGEGVVTQLWNEGYQTVEEILNLKISDLEKFDKFGKRKAKIVYDNIHSKMNGVELSKLQHATGFFMGLGSKKLALLEHFTEKPTIDQVINIEGFAQKSAEVYIENYDRFFDFIKGLPITISSKKEVEVKGNRFEGKSFVFTGVRSVDAEKMIEELGGKIGSSVSKNTSYLVMKSKGSGSSKEIKAQSLGVEIITLEELLNLLK